MKPFITLQSRVVPLPIDNIDTDQIIPARYLKGVERAGLAEGLFANWRADPEFVLNQLEFSGARILLAGENFGCGSSREHAPWALQEYGFDAVISARFGDIFQSNALKNGLLPVVLPEGVVRQLLRDAVEGLELQIDLQELRVRTVDSQSSDENTQASTLGIPGSPGEWPFEVDRFSRRCLLEGVDQLGYLLRNLPQIERWESTVPASIPSTQPPQENR